MTFPPILYKIKKSSNKECSCFSLKDFLANFPLSSAQQFILIRGLPGSGKSTVAEEIKKLLNCRHFEADMFFIEDDGKYVFNWQKLSEAHRWCLASTKKALEAGESVIVSNTSIRIQEFQKYLDLSKAFNCEIIVIECFGKFQNIHGVPENTLKKMRENWEEFYL